MLIHWKYILLFKNTKYCTEFIYYIIKYNLLPIIVAGGICKENAIIEIRPMVHGYFPSDRIVCLLKDKTIYNHKFLYNNINICVLCDYLYNNMKKKKVILL